VSDKPVVAVGVAIINEDKELLVAKRSSDKPMPNKWEFPGGKLEENETLEACGRREIKEELALDITVDRYLGLEKVHYNQKDFILHFFTARLKDPNQRLVLNEHSDARWLSFDALGDYDFPVKELGVMKRIEEVLGLM